MTTSTIDPDLLDRVFGKSEGATAKDRARGSSKLFVRGLDQLTFDDRPEATGRRLTAAEALDAYGFDTLAEVASEGSALLCESVDAVGRVLRERRAQLDLPIRTISSETGLAPAVIEALEASKRRPLREYEKVARALGLDERMLSFRSIPEGNQDVAVRLREMHDSRPVLTSSVVISLAEAAWVAMTQLRLEAELALAPAKHEFDEDANYGSIGLPAYKVGYHLANSFRTRLGLGTKPIMSMRHLLENDLRIPVIQANLGTRVAGATVDSAGRRAIVVNLSGRNQNPFVRRSTLAHELCHLLFDPQQKLRNLRVDEYAELDEREDQRVDPVEQRANAFAVQLLAPQSSAMDLYNATTDDKLGRVMDDFGVSFTAARFQIWNALERRVPLETISATRSRPEVDWEGREGYTTTYHPIRSLADHPSRAGRFSAVVLCAVERGVVSWDSASEWLFCSEQELRDTARSVHELYPDLFDVESNLMEHKIAQKHTPSTGGKKAHSEEIARRATRDAAKFKTARAAEQPTTSVEVARKELKRKMDRIKNTRASSSETKPPKPERLTSRTTKQG